MFDNNWRVVVVACLLVWSQAHYFLGLFYWLAVIWLLDAFLTPLERWPLTPLERWPLIMWAALALYPILTFCCSWISWRFYRRRALWSAALTTSLPAVYAGLYILPFLANMFLVLYKR